ncbi:hypothetical protein ILP97_00995 [Amycolatopsis sp. H6(2020)]|nr:hypothetical protein [Amycolatopsis sp. H6(2020)]
MTDARENDLETLTSWVNQLDWPASETFLTDHPELLTEQSVRRLHRLADTQPRATTALKADDHAWLLQLCRRHGVAAGYAEYHRVVDRARQLRSDTEAAEREFIFTSDPVPLERALTAARESDELVTGTSLSRVRGARLDLGRMLLRRFRLAGAEAELNEAVATLDAAWLVPGAVARTQAVVTEALAAALRTRFEATRDERDLQRAIEVLERSLAALPEDSATRPGLLGALGQALRLRYTVGGDRDDLERAIRAFTDAEDWINDVLALRPARLGDLATGLMQRYQATTQPEDLDRAITAFGEALAGAVVGSPDRDAHVLNVGTALLLRYNQTHVVEDLNAAQDLLSEAVTRSHPSSPLGRTARNTLSMCLRDRYHQTGDPAFLDAAVEQAEAVLDGYPRGTAPAECLAQLAVVLVARMRRDAESTIAATDLDRAVLCYDRAVAATPHESPKRPDRLTGLGICLAERYLRTGAVANLDRAIETLRVAARETPSRSLNTATDRLSLGNVLWLRYARNHRLDDLNAALEVLHGAVNVGREDSAERPACLNSLAIALAERYAWTGRTNDLDDCVDLFRQARQATPSDSPEHAEVSGNLGTALRNQAAALGSESLRNESVALLRTTLDTVIARGMPSASLRHTLASTLLTATSAPSLAPAVDEASDLLKTAVAVTPETSVDAVRYHASLGHAHHIRHRLTGDAQDLRNGTEHLRIATAAAVDTDLELAADTALERAGWARELGDRPAAADAYRDALKAVRALVGEQATRGQKERWLRRTTDIHIEAADTFRYIDPAEAGVALELGRGVLLTELLDLASPDLDRLARERPDLHARFRLRADRLAGLLATTLAKPAFPLPQAT